MTSSATIWPPAFTFWMNALPDASTQEATSQTKSNGVKSPNPGSSWRSRYCHEVAAVRLSASKPL
jgi:hypothetical protein